MAVVVWLFSGGGESEVRGLIPFLEKNFDCRFERKTPIRRKPGPKPPRKRRIQAYGKTGRSLEEQIKQQLRIALQHGTCDLILVVDDLDCHEPNQQKVRFLDAVKSILGTRSIDTFVCFAAPELEAWIIADWNNTVAKDVDFRAAHSRMRWWLSHEKNVLFDDPEHFSVYDPTKDACAEKLSELMIEASERESSTRYSKAIHTPRFLQKIKPETVSQKCPLFREFYFYLSKVCQS